MARSQLTPTASACCKKEQAAANCRCLSLGKRCRGGGKVGGGVEVGRWGGELRAEPRSAPASQSCA